jgi:hypothetical protein
MSFAESTAGATLKPSKRDFYQYIALAILLPQETHEEMRACGKYWGEPSKVE